MRAWEDERRPVLYGADVSLASFWETMAFNDMPAFAASMASVQCSPSRNDICFNEWMKMDLALY